MSRFPETKGRTLEEIGALFGDDRIANRWYGLSEEERHRVAHGALVEGTEAGEMFGSDHVRSETERKDAVQINT